MDKTYYSFDLIFESNKIKNRFKYSSLDILIDIMNSFQHPGIRRSFASMLGEMYDIVKFFDGLFEEIFYELMIAPAEHVKENRWNPDGVAFMYLACGKREDKFDEIINLPQKTCFEEIRLENGSEVIICEFKPIIKNAKLINLYYEDENPSEIARNFYELPKEIKERGINSLLNDDKFILKMNEMVKKSKNKSDFEDKSKEEILYAIRNLGINDQIFKVANERLGRLFLTIIDKTIFEPVDKMDDPELKAYIPFRFFSNYLIEKGYDGIIYRSTRMNKIGLSGKNVVLFDNSYATYQLGSMKKFLRKDGRYIELKFD